MKKEFVILLIALAFVIIISKTDLLKAKPIEKEKGGQSMFGEADAKQAILAVEKKYGKEMAKRVEQIMRAETRHFKSGQYKATGSAGMEVGKWKDIPSNMIQGTIKMEDADKSDGIDEFIIWKSVTAFAFYLADYINRYKGNYARWNSTQKKNQDEYSTLINSIKPRFV